MNIILSVIIVSYKNIAILKNCLDSIFKFNDLGEQLEVIVSDNSPTSEVVDFVNMTYKRVITVKNENCGFGAGNNRGYEKSNGRYLLFLNPDTILLEPIFKYAVSKFENDSELALFGLQLLQRDGSLSTSFLSIDDYSIIDAIKSKRYRRKAKFIDGKMFICGADLFVRRSAFEECGKFDERIFMYKEEADLIKRIKLYSVEKKTAFFNDKKIIHLEGGTEEKNLNQRVIQMKRLYDSDQYYAQKWDLSLKRIFCQRRRYYRLKRLICICFCKYRESRYYTELIVELNTRLGMIKDSENYYD